MSGVARSACRSYHHRNLQRQTNLNAQTGLCTTGNSNCRPGCRTLSYGPSVLSVTEVTCSTIYPHLSSRAPAIRTDQIPRAPIHGRRPATAARASDLRRIAQDDADSIRSACGQCAASVYSSPSHDESSCPFCIAGGGRELSDQPSRRGCTHHNCCERCCLCNSDCRCSRYWYGCRRGRRTWRYQPTLDELIQMRIFKITPDFIHRMQAKGLNNLTISKLVQIRIFQLAE